MEEVSNSPTPSRHHPICPITLDVCRDPVLAGDGHVYERAAIIKWIEEQGTSPLTREPLDANDLCPIENIEQLDQSNSEVDSPSTSTMPLSFAAKIDKELSIFYKRICNLKNILFIILGFSFIVSGVVLITSIIFYFRQSTSTHSTHTTFTVYPSHLRNHSITFKPHNNCTLSHITLLFIWNDVNSFNYTYYSTLYKANSTRTAITFAFRNNPSFWCLDDVSVIDASSNTELVTNGGFEDNPPDGFIRCYSYRNSSTTSFTTSSYPHSGQRSFCSSGSSTGPPIYLSQTLSTKIDQTYQVSFWLENNGNTPNNAQVLMSY